MSSADEKGVREERTDEIEASDDEEVLRCCWRSKARGRMPPTFLDSLRLSSTKRFSLGVKVLILALTWKNIVVTRAAFTDFILSLWVAEGRSQKMKPYNPQVMAMDQKVVGPVILGQFPESRDHTITVKPGWAMDGLVTTWLHPQKFSNQDRPTLTKLPTFSC